MSRTHIAIGLTILLALGGCNGSQTGQAGDDMKKALDQIAQNTKDTAAQTKDLAGSAKTSSEDMKGLSGRIDELQRSLSAALAKQKRGAIFLQLDVEASCDNDEKCENTARAVCNRINYPNAITSKFTPGVRPTLGSLVCFD